MAVKSVAAPAREDVVYIRKSSDEQDYQAQIANVGSMLRDLEKYVPDRLWFDDTGSRRKADKRPNFQALLALIRRDKVRTVYVESQNRWGTKNLPEYFRLIGDLRDHGTALFDLRAKRDLTKDDMTTQLLGVVNSLKSEQELKDIAYQSLRTRVNNFKSTGTWPTGPHPFAYGKACYDSDRKLKWVWQPVSPSRGQVFNADADGNLTPGLENVPIPRKTRTDFTKLVPSNNADFLKAVRLIFDLYTRAGLSRRAISARLNAAGLRFYSRPWTHPHVTGVLTNRHYTGDVVFGKARTGDCTPSTARTALRK
jgi:DNA invertase Pin-like site-specific DNA recombinase